MTKTLKSQLKHILHLLPLSQKHTLIHSNMCVCVLAFFIKMDYILWWHPSSYRNTCVMLNYECWPLIVYLVLKMLICIYQVANELMSEDVVLCVPSVNALVCPWLASGLLSTLNRSVNSYVTLMGVNSHKRSSLFFLSSCRESSLGVTVLGYYSLPVVFIHLNHYQVVKLNQAKTTI